MRKFTVNLIGLTLALLSPLALAAGVVPKVEPTDDIIRNGRDLEWNAESNAGYVYATQQKLYREWMRETYTAWRSQWTEPLDAERFARENRRVRQILTAAHRSAVRSGNWNFRPSYLIPINRIPAVRPEMKQYSRPSRRLIIQDAEKRSR